VENDTPDTSAVLPNGHSTTGAGVNGISAADKTNSSFPEDTSHEPLLARSGNFELSFLDELYRRFFPSNFLLKTMINFHGLGLQASKIEISCSSNFIN
jgi:hypothetical protein